MRADGHAGPVPDHSPTSTPSRDVDPAVATRLREELAGVRRRERRSAFDASFHVGVPGADRAGFVLRARDVRWIDQQLRAEIVSGLLEEAPPDWRTAWLVRPGTPEPHDDDAAWLAAARLAFGMHARTLDGCYTLTWVGWRDLVADRITWDPAPGPRR